VFPPLSAEIYDFAPLGRGVGGIHVNASVSTIQVTRSFSLFRSILCLSEGCRVGARHCSSRILIMLCIIHELAPTRVNAIATRQRSVPAQNMGLCIVVGEGPIKGPHHYKTERVHRPTRPKLPPDAPCRGSRYPEGTPAFLANCPRSKEYTKGYFVVWPCL